MKQKKIQKHSRYQLMQQAVFGKTSSDRLKGIIHLSTVQDPEMGYLLEKILEKENDS